MAYEILGIRVILNGIITGEACPPSPRVEAGVVLEVETDDIEVFC